MFKFNLVTFTVGAIVVTLASQAFADPIGYAGTGLTSDVTIRHNSSDMYVRAGEIFVDFDAIRLTAYCVDLNDEVQNNWTATTAPVTTVNGGLAAAYLYDHFASTVTTGAEAAGLQIAIWEVVDDSSASLNLVGGNFNFTGSKSVSDAAQSYLSALPADLTGYTTQSFILKSGSSPQSQDLIVPEPASLVLLGSVLPMFLTGRKR